MKAYKYRHKEVSSMEEFNTERKSSELNKEEVNEEKRIEVTENEELLKEEVDIYELPDCDIVRKKCENDCIGGGAFLNTTK